ncbi:hypothetical protein T484DRAFT_1821358 [Baffinella frigidus]|nr:hypothetical protein T484DRAFT_1821358 [Cryptophyta sp. CCMP2293]
MEQRRAKSEKRMRRRVMVLIFLIALALGYLYAASNMLPLTQAQAASPGAEAAKSREGSWPEVALSSKSPTFPSGLDELNVKAELVAPLAEDFILPSQKTVAENREHTRVICEKWLAQRWGDSKGAGGRETYELWRNGFSQFGQVTC